MSPCRFGREGWYRDCNRDGAADPDPRGRGGRPERREAILLNRME